jgi:RimJ/RimL family protein N-acetyltransferase
MSISPPERIDLEDDTYLRWMTVDDAGTIARAVGESLDYLKPWMPWADAQSTDVEFQRGRLRNQAQQRERAEEWQYGLFRSGDDSFLGSFGLMTRRGPGTLEIGYWLHVDAGNRGHATKAALALTEAGLQSKGIDRMMIVCDEANVRSAAIPKRLGYTLQRVEQRPREAPGETGRTQFWVADRIADRIPPATTP